MKPILEKCPKFKNDYAQRWGEKGFAAALAGKPLSALDTDEPDSTYQPGGRFAWISGWEFGGGDIMREVVVPQRQRWEEERAELVKRLAWLDTQLAATS